MLGSNCQSVTLTRTALMPVEDVFSITGRGTVATGRIETGVVNSLEMMLISSVWVLKN